METAQMVFLAGWVLVLLLLALWSALVWSGEAMLAALLSHASVLGSGDWSLPQSLADLLPAWAAEWLVGTLENFSPQLHALVGALPGLSGWVHALAWVVWSVGAVLLLGTGLAIHVAIALWRKSRDSTPPRIVAP
ncbi:hypothetical protein [Roseateles sp.]|uniref:hypothetical protein n=1 Tax=Roseateles sp. TaxID=1971397 RepID=UPI003267D1D9